PIDDDALASRERTTEPLDRAIQIEHRRTLFGRARRQEGGHVAGRETAAGEHLRDERGDTIRDIPGLFGHDPAPLRREGHLTFKYLARVFTLALAVASCTQSTTPTRPAGSPLATTTGTALTAIGLADKPIFIVQALVRKWYMVPDSLSQEGAPAAISFPGIDAAPGRPRARLRSTGRAVELAPTPSTGALGTMGPPVWTGTVPLDGAAPGPQTIDYLVRMSDGSDTVLWSATFLLSQPEYVVWTLDFEGDASSDEAMANTWDIAQSNYVPMTIMW